MSADRRGVLARRSFIAALCLTAAAVLFTGQVRGDYMYAGRDISWMRALALSLVDWELWALLAPAVLALAARAPIARGRLVSALAVHVPLSLLFAFGKSIAEAALVRTMMGGRTPFGLGKLYMALVVYWALVGAAHYADQRRLTRERELRAAQLETELARAQVDALRMQLHPHFLFNTLNTIAGLMREDVEAADLMLAQLSDLLRRTLDQDGQEVPLDEELRWLRTYLAIQQTRYGDRLRVDIDVDPQCAIAAVPAMLLQPLVENAIRHGFSATPGPGCVTIRARCGGGRLELDVEDEGPGLAEPIREGHGLRNTRSRLRALYGASASLRVESRQPPPGTRSRVELPFKAAGTAS